MRAVKCYSAVVVIGSLALSGRASAELKQVPYPAIKVEIAKPYKPDAAFEKMRKAFADATAHKDADALFALVAPGFVWTVGGALTSQFDPGREPLHNFKVLFGFRQLGKDSDGGVKDGPFWDTLIAYAKEDTYYQAEESSGLVCSPIAASVEDQDALAEAREKIETADEASDWYFTVRATPVSKSPDDKQAPIATLSGEAVPVLNTFPAAKEDEPAPPVTHYEILLPSGKSGWIPAAAARPLEGDRLCYALTAKGEWAIGLYDSGRAQQQSNE